MRMININSNFKDITYNNLDKTKLPGDFATFLANTATCYRTPLPEGKLISYQTATGYMSSFKCSMVNKGHLTGSPTQFQQKIWSRILAQIRHENWEHARNNNIKLFGSEKSVTRNDRMGLLAIGLWSGTLDDTEFMNLFNSMIENCGRGSEIAISEFW